MRFLTRAFRRDPARIPSKDRDTWLSDLLARASRDEHDRGHDQAVRGEVADGMADRRRGGPCFKLQSWNFKSWASGDFGPAPAGKLGGVFRCPFRQER